MNDIAISFPATSALIYSNLQILEFKFNYSINFNASTYDNNDVWIDTIIFIN